MLKEGYTSVTSWRTKFSDPGRSFNRVKGSSSLPRMNIESPLKILILAMMVRLGSPLKFLILAYAMQGPNVL